jgi:hypothetical protein
MHVTYLLRKHRGRLPNVLGGPRESSNEIHQQGIQAFHRAKFIHMSSLSRFDLGFLTKIQ